MLPILFLTQEHKNFKNNTQAQLFSAFYNKGAYYFSDEADLAVPVREPAVPDLAVTAPDSAVRD